MKHKALFIVLGIFVIASMVLSACTPSAPATEAPAAPTEKPMEEPPEEPTAEPPEEPMEDMHPALEDGKLVIAWIPKALNNPVFEIGKVGAETKAAELTAAGPYEVEIMYSGSVASDMAEQARVMADAVTAGAEAMGVSCNDPTGCIDPINDAIGQGIDTMTWDSDAPDSDRFTYLGVDNYEGGLAAGALLVQYMGEEGKVALLTGVPGAFNLEERIRGFTDYVADYPGIEIVTTVACNDDINLGVQVVEETMQAYPDLDGWFFVGLWPLFAERGSMPLWEEATLAGMINVVFDTLPLELEYVQDGYISGLVGQKYWGWGYDTVQMIYDKIVNGAEYESFTNSGMDLVDTCNVDVMAEMWAQQDFTIELPPLCGAEAVVSDYDGMVVAADSCDYGGKISSIEAVDEFTVVYNLCKPDPAFMAKMAFTPFAVEPCEYINETGGTDAILEAPIGTGPFYVESWNRGDSVVFKRFEDYWGDQPAYDTLVFRWATEGAARLLELQSGTVSQITNLSPDDVETVGNDPNLTLLPVSNPNILYLAMTNTFEPFDNQLVRQAVAMGVDRQRIVDNFYPVGSEVASHFTPCAIPNGCEGEPWYDFDPEAARALLAEAGFPDGFSTSIFYRDVYRGYLPEPALVAVEFQTQLKENLNIDAEVVVMESGEFIAESQAGNLDGFYLLGWGADYPHITNFLDFHFVGNPQYGDVFPEYEEPLQAASQIGDPAEAAPLYAEANNALKEMVPMVPIAHGGSFSAALASVENAHFRPFGAPLLDKVDPGTDTFVYMQNNEPISLYCADESDGESLAPCQQALEPLYDYEIDSGNVRPMLATSCEPNDDLTVWTCSLREGVKFHDGSDFDANDVVCSWSAGIDYADPNHTGNTGTFFYYAYLWDGLINAPAEE